MKTIIGLGTAGCNIAASFSKYPQYKIYKINKGLQNSKDCLKTTKSQMIMTLELT